MGQVKVFTIACFVVNIAFFVVAIAFFVVLVLSLLGLWQTLKHHPRNFRVARYNCRGVRN